MATVRLVAVIRFRWWLRLYLSGVVVTSRITGLDHDWQKVSLWIRRGTVVRVKAAQ
jgi:hypothetical protein